MNLNFLSCLLIDEGFHDSPDTGEYPRSICYHQLTELLWIIVLSNLRAKFDKALHSLIKHTYAKSRHVKNWKSVEDLFLCNMTASKKVQLDNLLVHLHEIAHKCFLINCLPKFVWFYLSWHFDVYWTPDFVDSHITFTIELLQFYLFILRYYVFLQVSYKIMSKLEVLLLYLLLKWCQFHSLSCIPCIFGTFHKFLLVRISLPGKT